MATTPPRFHRLTVREVVRQTPHAVSIVFTVPPELADDYAFEPGQYLTLRTTIGFVTTTRLDMVPYTARPPRSYTPLVASTSAPGMTAASTASCSVRAAVAQLR